MGIEGINLSMNYDFLADVKLGTLQVDIFPTRKPRQRKNENGEVSYIYKFKTLCSQETKPVTYGEIVCLSKNEINL